MKNVTAIIMAAGKGVRLLPFTSTTPKPLIRVMGKSIFEYNLDILDGLVKEIIIVVGYQKEKIISYFGDRYKNTKITYVDQKKPRGTAHALFSTKDVVTTNNLLVMNGDDLYGELIKNILRERGDAIVGEKKKNWRYYGVLKARAGGFLEKIVEKPESFVGDLVNTGLYKVKSDIFKYFKKVNKSKRNEYEITDLISFYVRDHETKIINSYAGWTPLSYPWDLLEYSKNNLADFKTDIKGEIEKNTIIKGKIQLGIDSIIKSGAYLEGNFYIGQNCVIGPNCYLRGFGSFDDGVVIGNAVEVTRSIVGKNTNIKHLSYIGDSIIGNNVSLGAGTITSNLRHDESNILVDVGGVLVDSKREKLGAIIADDVKTGIHTSLYPGTKLDIGVQTQPGQVVKYKS